MKFWLTVFAFVTLIAATIWGIGNYLSPNDLANCSGRPSEGKCAAADVIVAVSGGDTAARTNQSVELYKSGWAPKLIFSGAAEDKTSKSNAEVMRGIAVRAGVPSSDIIVETTSRNTSENAINTMAIVDRLGLKRVIVVTSQYHQRRASIEFQHSSSHDDVTILSHPANSDNQWSDYWWLTPYGWWLALGELIKIIFTHLNGLIKQ